VVRNLLLVAGILGSVPLHLQFAGRLAFYYIIPLAYLAVTIAAIWLDGSV
jgi:hypothetical protein